MADQRISVNLRLEAASDGDFAPDSGVVGAKGECRILFSIVLLLGGGGRWQSNMSLVKVFEKS